jgi:hypothetical protein
MDQPLASGPNSRLPLSRTPRNRAITSREVREQAPGTTDRVRCCGWTDDDQLQCGRIGTVMNTVRNHGIVSQKKDDGSLASSSGKTLKTSMKVHHAQNKVI